MSLDNQDTRPVPEYRLVPLSQGQSAKVDGDDFEWISQWKWSALWCKGTQSFYAVRNQYIPGDRNHPKRLIMAREIMRAPKTLLVDHKSGDTLDNRKGNLRIATSAQNQQNTKTPHTNTSGIRGVYYSPKINKSKPWRSCIRHQGKMLHLGFFFTKDAAAAMYRDAAMRLRGEFARF